MAETRNSPYVWVTWLSKVMAGEQSCLWAPWFRSHHQNYHKLNGDLDLARWNVEHTRLLTETRTALLRTGAEVRVEGQNSFRYAHASGGTLAGKPDIVAINDTGVMICDCKTGRPRISDRIQVMIYMLTLPYCQPKLAVYSIQGKVIYRDSEVLVPAASVDDRFGQHFDYFMNLIVAPDSPPPSPSSGECRFCDIGGDDCAVRCRGGSGA